MNKDMVKKAVLALCIVSLLVSAGEVMVLAQRHTPKYMAAGIMKKIAAGDLESAFKIIRGYSSLTPEEMDAIFQQTKTLKENFGKRFGATMGYRILDVRKRGADLMRLRYVEKTEKNPLFWSFYFYRGKKGWILNGFYWNNDYSSLF